MKIFHSIATGVGVAKVMQPLPNEGLRRISPFLLLHHVGPTMVPAGQDGLGVGAHPHRGFEPVTFLFKGGLEHKDSMGNVGILNDGDVQWMTAGSGVLHSEHSHEAFKKTGGEFHFVQLWVNLPREHKLTAPRYQDMRSSTIPQFSLGKKGSYGRVIAGLYDGHEGPADTFTPINALHVVAKEGDDFAITLEKEFNSFVYILTGSVETNGQEMVRHQLGIPEEDQSNLAFHISEDSEFLVLSGQPIDEPLATYGPFVMNTHQELNDAIRDYQMGKMGSLS